MSGDNLLKEVQGLSNSYLGDKKNSFIQDAVIKMKDKAASGYSSVTLVTNNVSISDAAVTYFKGKGFKCSVFCDPAEDYGDIDAYHLTIRW